MELLLAYSGYYLIFCLVCAIIVVLHTYIANTQKKYKLINRVPLSDMLVGLVCCNIPVLNIILVWFSINEIIRVKCYNFNTIYPFSKKE